MNKTKKVLLTIVVLLLFTMLGLNIYLILNKEIVQTTNITKTEKEGDDLKVDIEFDKAGHKRLMARFAGLEIITE